MATPGTQGSPAAAPTSGRAPLQHAAVAVGGLFLALGVLGFIPGVTTDYDALAFAGHHSGAALFGLFAVSGLHNAIHLIFGVLGVALSGTFNGARGFLIAGAAGYGLLAGYGFVVARDSPANVIPVDNAGNWLHLTLALGMLILVLIWGRTRGVAHDRRHT
ncbi:DUF4383 domain-containing protein [Mycobacterium sp. SMC-4]|uniref:DUF4383 domain-containing protein n=1 Tax=Mycobacterium sp. SMC-4 TaxID=2857059 RepID=UPI0021B17E54|nr:DUF4383 domain-containing protein [Mycobacterium sp. SMC-4]UXA17979.1 DUF4383 domain-containing protein [Mycobacterium sp. SMC-4]